MPELIEGAPELIEVNYHRNGVGGTPFFVVLFLERDLNEVFLATYFPEQDKDGEYLFNCRGGLAIVSLNRIDGGYGVGHKNRWRSANWHNWIDKVIQEWRE